VPSQCFVINEWLLEDLLGENGPEREEQSHQFLLKLIEKCDKIAVMEPSPWLDKAWKLSRHGSPKQLEYGRILFGRIYVDPRKCHHLYKNEVKSLPEGLKELIGPKDQYLVETYCSVQDVTLLVTTDKKHIFDALFGSSWDIKAALRDDFLNDYLGSR